MRTARSRVGALGLMQLFGVSRSGITDQELLESPRANIMAGARWLSLLEVWCGDLRRGLGAYNTGQCRAGRRFARHVLRIAERR